MIKNILIFVLIVLLAWTSKDKFSIQLPVDIPTYIECSKKIPRDTSSINPVQNHFITDKIEKEEDKAYKTISLDMLLKQNKFYDALSYYLNHTTKNNEKKIENYLALLSKRNPLLSIEYMHIYLDEVPESLIKNLLITTYISQNNYPKAIELIIAYKENYVSQTEDKRLSSQLKKTALQYIDRLMDKKEYIQLIQFLEEMITHDSEDSFYRFKLAQLYMTLDKTSEASSLLDDLQYDEIYAQKAKNYIEKIDLTKKNNYEYIIPLTKHGDHYLIDTVLDGISFRLILDTGATYIYLDSDKASSLEVLNKNLKLQTAGEDVHAELRRVSIMQVGNLELNNMEVTTAPFKRDGIDGLLGMNFLKQFEFFINQEEATLYLKSK